MKQTHLAEVLNERVPSAAAAYAFQLWEQTPFKLVITKTRQTKVGDFTGRPGAVLHRITLNHDLNPYLFLLTYIHEVAHLRVYLHYGNRVEPHGPAWKRAFQRLMEPVLNEQIFPEPLLQLLTSHMQNPKASSFGDKALTLALRAFDPNSKWQTMVSELPEGSVFRLQGRFFKKGPHKRTRILCRELKSKKQYLVPAEALVSEVQLSLL